MTINQDQKYISKVLEGDTNAFAFIVDSYKDLVYTLALRMTKNKEEAEEVSQDTFIKVFKNLSKFKGDSKFSTWIYKVTYNTCLDNFKKQKRVRKTVAINAFTENEVKTMDNALSIMEANERQKIVHDCIAELPSEEAFVLTLYYYEELSLEEIAKVINLKANNVKVKLFRSRKKLATILRARLEPEIIERYEG